MALRLAGGEKLGRFARELPVLAPADSVEDALGQLRVVAQDGEGVEGVRGGGAVGVDEAGEDEVEGGVVAGEDEGEEEDAAEVAGGAVEGGGQRGGGAG